MDFQNVIDQLRSELNRIDQAISVLQSLGSSTKGRRRGRPPGSKNHVAATTPKRRTMSASARALISAAQKARWAKQKKASPGTAAKSRASCNERCSPETHICRNEKEMGAAEEEFLVSTLPLRWAADCDARFGREGFQGKPTCAEDPAHTLSVTCNSTIRNTLVSRFA